MEAKFILSKKKLLEQYNTLKKLCDIVCYSAKTNYEAAEQLEKLTDSQFSIHSIEGLEKIKNKKKCWFFAQGWSKEEINKIFETGIENFVVDNENDLKILLECNKKINLLLRMRLKEHTIHTGKYFVYGMYSEQINKWIPELRKNKNIGKLGIHFHRKSQNISEWSLQYELQELLTEETLKNVDYINIGGGIPVKYKNFKADVLEHIFEEITKLRNWLKENNIQLIIEPGRFIAAPCIKLETTITNVYNSNIIINCSVYNSAMDTFVAHNKLEIEGELEEGQAYTIKGLTPCSMDIFRYRVFLKNPKVGDKIIFLNAGAYNFTTDFCNLKKLKTEAIE